VLFDLYGVLVDSVRVVERAWRRWAREQHLGAEEVLAAVHGRRAQDVVGMFAPHLDLSQQVRRITRYEAQDSGGLAVMPGAAECVSVASQNRWAVVTSGGRDLAARRLAAAGLPVPDVLVTGDDVACGKPDPEPYLNAARVLAGKRAGMTVLAVTTTHEAAALIQADRVFATMHDITQYLIAANR
jgi:sugar-phosphatase